MAVVFGSCRQIRGQADFWSLHHFSAHTLVLWFPACRPKHGVSLTSCGQWDGIRVNRLGGSEAGEGNEDQSSRGRREHFGLVLCLIVT